jgi:nickel-dependent lactate racemase
VKTRTVSLPYGRGRLWAEIPERYLASIAVPKEMRPVPHPEAELRRALSAPIDSLSLDELARGAKNPCIIISDSTRPTPSGMIVEAALRSLCRAGIPEKSVRLVVATGLHRPSTEEELMERLGRGLLNRLEVLNHDARDDFSLVNLGRTSWGTPLWLNEAVHESDLVIGDGYIEPHFFAGYTGGGKNILPGVSGLETIKANHGAAMIDHPQARAGVLDGNPIYEDIVEGARRGGLDFSINVTLDPQKRISGIFAGEFEEAHRGGSEFLDGHVKVETPEADIVVTTNGGYPLDRDLYQAVKGMTVAEGIAREGGVAIVASECMDGVGHPKFRELVERGGSPLEILEIIRAPGFFEIDQWEAQILARVLTRCDVICVTGVEAAAIRGMHMIPAASVDEALSLARKSVGRDPEIVVVPGGPSTIPFTK